MAYKGLEDDEKGKVNWGAAVIPIVLVLLFLLALVIRGVFYWPPAVEPVQKYGDEGYLLSGNDPNYHKRTVDYVQQTHQHLVWDPMLDFPKGGPNPNPPLYAWCTAIMGYTMAPFYGGDVHTATWVAMEWAVTFWAALTIFPTYVFTRDMFGKKAGLWAAFFLAVMAGNVERTPVGFSDHDGIMVFFIVLSFLFLMRSLRMLNNRTYVKDYFDSKSIALGTRELIAENKKAILYAILASFAISGVSLAWKGVAYIYAIVLIYFVFHLVVKKLKQEEGLGIALVILLSTGLSLLITFPYYNIDYFTSWFESPFFVFAAMCILALLLVPTRDLPWLLVIPLIAALVFGGVYGLTKLFPEVMNTIFSLQGYFVKTKLYETIAEAQAPAFSRMVFSYGVITFYLALIGAGFACYRLPAEKWRNDYIMTVIWAIVSIYMAMSAVRFMYNATPVFAIMAGWVTAALIKITGYDEMLRTYNGLKTERLYAIRKSVKPRHVLTVLFVGFLIVFPNTWYGIDAGIPYEKKAEYDKNIYNALPGPVNVPPFGELAFKPSKKDYDSAGNWYIGAFGTDYPSDYWVDGMFWLADQDNQSIPEERPGFISWWDYGHWAVHMGQHPSAADNFQNGFQWAGNYISAQNESIAIALVIAKIVDGNMYKDKKVLDILEEHTSKEARDDFWNYSVHPAEYKDHILDNPHIYGPHDSKRMDPVNIKWLMTSRMLTNALDEEELVNLLHDLEDYTGQSLRYFAMDTRLLPVGPTNTGIFYAPIKLSDQNIDDFLVVYAIGNDGSRTNVNDENAMKAKYKETDYAVQSYEIEYRDMFFDSMFYKCYIGWKPTELEINEAAIPIVSRASDVGRDQLEVASMPPMQGWGMTHYRLAYRTIYWNPNRTEPSQHPKDWKIVSPSDAAKYKNWSESDDTEVQDKAGVLDTTYRGLFGGVFFLKYYDGAFVNGTVTLNDGTPLEGVRVTVYDDTELLSTQWPGIPHGYTYTDKDGKYSIVAPFGNVTVRMTNGGQDASGNSRTEQLMLQKDKRLLNDTKIMVSDNQAMRVEEDLDGDGVWDYNIKHDVQLNYSTVKGSAFWDLDKDGKFTEDIDEPMVGMVSLNSSGYGKNVTATLASNGSYEVTNVIPDDYSVIYNPVEGQRFGVISSISVDIDATVTQDVIIVPSQLNGTVTDMTDEPIEDAQLVLEDRNNKAIRYEFLSGVNGTYSISRVLPGNYSLFLDDERYSAQSVSLDINEGTNITQNMTVSTTIEITGTARMGDGSPVTGGWLVARNVLDDTLSVDLRIDADGKLHGHLAQGNYSINGKVIKGGETYAYMKVVEIMGPTTLDLTFKRAYRINGTVYEDINGNDKYDPPTTTSTSTTPTVSFKEAEADVEMEFDGPTGNFSMISNNDGGYEAYLEPGEYTVYLASSAATGLNLTSLTSLKVTADLKLDLQVNKGTSFKGTVYYDMDLDLMIDDGEALDRATLTFDDGAVVLTKHTSADGSLQLFLPDGTYNVGASYAGYTSYGTEYDIKGGQLNKNIVLNPSNITVTGIAGFDENGDGRISLSEGLEIVLKFIPEDVTGPADEITLTTNDDGSFTTALFPVNYTVRVDQKVVTASGDVQYKYTKDLALYIGQGSTDINMALDKLFKVTGSIYYDLNNNDILNLGERRSPALKFYAPDGTASEAKVTPDGFEVYLKAGKYYYYSHMGEPASGSQQSAFLGSVYVTSESNLTLKLVPATRVNGVLYYDNNKNGEVDTGEQERDVTVRFSEMAGETIIGSITTLTNDIGEYSIYLPWDTNYTVAVDQTYDRKLYNKPYTVKYAFHTDIVAASGDPSIGLDLNADKLYRVYGNVTYVSPSGPVKLAGAVIKYDTFTTTSNATGGYSLFVRPGKYPATVTLPGFTLPKTIFGNRTINYDTTLQDFTMDPLNVTLEGHVFIDLNGDGLMDDKNEGVQAQIVEFIAADFRAVNASTTTIDPRGKFTIELKPGSYYVWIQATSGIRHYAAFEEFGLDASGTVAVRQFEVTEANALLGNIYLINTSGVRTVPTGVNITLERNNTGAVRYIPVTTMAYTYYLPAGEYNLSSEFQDTEYGQVMKYHLYKQVNLTDMMKEDLKFEKEKKFHLEVLWESKEKARLAQNKSVTYSYTLKNVGNEPATWDVYTSLPTGWKATPSTKKITLGIYQSEKITVLINVSTDAKAGDNTITVGGQIPDIDAMNTTRSYVDVIQVFKVNVSASDQKPTIQSDGSYKYYVTVKNGGNGQDKVYISLAAPFPNWNITISEPNPTLTKGQEKDISVILKPSDDADVKNMVGRDMTLRIQAQSQSGEVDEYELPVTFPDLVGSIEVTGAGVKEVKSNARQIGPWTIPGFEPVLAVVAVLIAALIIRRRGGGRR